MFEPGDIYLSGRGGGCLLFVTGGRMSEARGGCILNKEGRGT